MANRTYHPRGVLVDGVPPRQHPLYHTWAGMLARCYNPDSESFKNYGGRGITVDPRWHHFASFAQDMGPKPDDKLSIERMDNDAGYSKGNCKWGTDTEQAWNRRTFVSNTSGVRGVKSVKDRYFAAFDYEKQRYCIGRFDTLDEAAAARAAFIGLFFRDRPAALQMLAETETVWHTSTTGLRGITPHADGGFIVRVTRNGVRQYLGYFKTLADAVAAKEAAKKQNQESNP